MDHNGRGALTDFGSSQIHDSDSQISPYTSQTICARKQFYLLETSIRPRRASLTHPLCAQSGSRLRAAEPQFCSVSRFALLRTTLRQICPASLRLISSIRQQPFLSWWLFHRSDQHNPVEAFIIHLNPVFWGCFFCCCLDRGGCRRSGIRTFS